jgi:hypothetical protein
MSSRNLKTVSLCDLTDWQQRIFSELLRSWYWDLFLYQWSCTNITFIRWHLSKTTPISIESSQSMSSELSGTTHSRITNMKNLLNEWEKNELKGNRNINRKWKWTCPWKSKWAWTWRSHWQSSSFWQRTASILKLCEPNLACSKGERLFHKVKERKKWGGKISNESTWLIEFKNEFIAQQLKAATHAQASYQCKNCFELDYEWTNERQYLRNSLSDPFNEFDKCEIVRVIGGDEEREYDYASIFGLMTFWMTLKTFAVGRLKDCNSRN